VLHLLPNVNTVLFPVLSDRSYILCYKLVFKVLPFTRCSLAMCRLLYLQPDLTITALGNVLTICAPRLSRRSSTPGLLLAGV
jgi:hypothetical protein